MIPQLKRFFQNVGEKYKMQGPYLEIGAAGGPNSILSGAYFADKPGRTAINMVETKHDSEITFQKCNSNDMKGVFPDNHFGTVLSNAVLEHDKQFWLSIAEMKRVLAPGGYLVIGAPGYIPGDRTGVTFQGLDTETRATITYDVHSRPDYWRFGRDAFQHVFCEGLELLELRPLAKIPRLVCVARKPENPQ